MTIVASSDLGGLGTRKGSPVEYNWVMPSIAPLLVPYLAILGLLTLKSNRRPAAWFIWLPLGCVVAVMLIPMKFLPSDADPLRDVVAALAFGLAAVWLLSNYLHQSHRFLTFLCVLIAAAVFGELCYVLRAGWNMSNTQTVIGGILLAIGALVTSVALSLGSLTCRNRYRPLRLYPCLFLVLIVLWLLIALPFFLVAVIASGVPFRWSEFFNPILIISTANFAILLPYLILSSANPFFRDRLRALLNVKPDTSVSLNTLPL